MTDQTKTCEIRSDGSRYYIGHGSSRFGQTYATPENAKRAAEKKGLTVVGRLPDPKASSVAHLCTFHRLPGSSFLTLETALGEIQFKGKDDETLLDLVNEAFYRMGYKPVRITSNMLNPNGREFLIDQDTPRYCDPGSEAYHSM